MSSLRCDILGAGHDEPWPANSQGKPPAFWGIHATVTAVVLVVLVVLAFSPCLGNEFVCWDDQENFLDNSDYRGLGWSQIRWAWTSFRIGVYQPLAWMILSAQYALFGLRPWAYHLCSLILYAFDTVVLFALILSLLKRSRGGLENDHPAALVAGAGLAVGLFAVHPLRCEVVAWASCQPYLVCALFSILSVLTYLRAFPEGGPERRGWLFITFSLFTAALLSKAVAVSLPAVLMVLDVYPLRRLRGAHGRRLGSGVWRIAREKLPFAGLSVVFMLLAYAGRAEARHLAPPDGSGFPSRVAQACYGVWFYPIKTVLPWPITAYYPMPERTDLGELPFLLSLLGTLGVSLAVLLWRKKRPALACAWFSYLVVLIPTSGLVRSGNQVAADRYAYMAMIGLLVPFAAGVCRLMRPARLTGLVCAALAAALIPGLVCLSRGQCRTWRTSERLWSHVLANGAGRDFIALKMMGAILLVQGRNEEALARLTESVRLRPDYADTRYNVGLALSRLGRSEAAAAQYAEAVRLDPDHADAHANLGVMLSRQGRFDEAERRFARVLRLDPDHVNAHYNLGLIASERGRLERARAEFAAALGTDPGHANARANLGVVLARQGRLREAVTQLAEALRLDPGHAEARANLGVVLSRLDRTDEAIAEHAEPPRPKPADPNAIISAP